MGFFRKYECSAFFTLGVAVGFFYEWLFLRSGALDHMKLSTARRQLEQEERYERARERIRKRQEQEN